MTPTPRPRDNVADTALPRPDWTTVRDRDRRMLWLDKNENADPALTKVVASVLREINTDSYHTYPESGRLYRKLARSLGVSPDKLLLAAGSDGVIRSVFEAFVEPGDAVLRTNPTFAMYAVYSRIYGAREITLNYRPSDVGPILVTGDVIAVIRDERPRLVCLPNPDSPTGTVFNETQMRAIIEAASEVGAVILVDEAYHPFYPETVASWIDEYGHLAVARSTGKAWALAGFRIGYAIAPTSLTAILHKVRPMYETSTVAVAAFERMLDYTGAVEESVTRLEVGKRSFLSAMDDLGFRTLHTHGNFLHVAFGRQSDAVHEALADHVVYRKHFAEPCLAGFSRFTATTAELFEPLIARITAVVKGA